MRLRIVRYLLFLFIPIQLFAQDANYWSSDYGAGGFFVPGAILANNHDSGVLFFNPALLAFDKRNAASISGTVYQWQSMAIKNGTGTGMPLKSAHTNIVPLIASHTIHFKTQLPFTLVYALVHTPVINFQASQYKDEKINVLDDTYSPGAENFIGQYTIGNNVRQTTALIGSGVKLGGGFAAGLSVECLMRSQSFLLNYSSRAVVNDGSAAGFPDVVSVAEYYLANAGKTGIRVKAGISYDISDKHHLGLTVISPLEGIAGKANIVSDNEVINLHLGGSALNLLANTRQSKLKSKWKAPLSIAAGYIYHHNKGELYIAAEYFAKVNEYNVITPGPKQFIRTDSLDGAFTTNLLRMKDVRKAVLNVAAGASWLFKENLTAFFSLRTDFTYADRSLYKDTDGYLSNISSWNIYHCQLGVNAKRKKFNLRIGLLISYGSSNKVLQGVNYDNPNESNLLIGEIGKTRGGIFSAGLMVSYIHNL